MIYSAKLHTKLFPHKFFTHKYPLTHNFFITKHTMTHKFMSKSVLKRFLNWRLSLRC